MVGLRYLKHAYNESDESVCERWALNVFSSTSMAKERPHPGVQDAQQFALRLHRISRWSAPDH